MNLLSVFNSKSSQFFEWYCFLADNNLKAAKKLEGICRNIKDLEKNSKQISKLEHESDGICLKVFDEINKTFITPMDREDISALTRSLDEVIDLINLTANTMSAYNLKKINKTAIQITELAVQSTKIVAEAIPKFKKRRTYKDVNKAVNELNTIETKADELLKEGLRALFSKPNDPVDIIRWRDIYNMLEGITDKTEDIADILHDLIIKYA